MVGDWALGISAVWGMVTTLAVIAGFFARARVLRADREFERQRRPADLSGLPSVTIIVPCLETRPGTSGRASNPSWPSIIRAMKSLSSTISRPTPRPTPCAGRSAKVRPAGISVSSWSTTSADDEGTEWAYGKSRGALAGRPTGLGRVAPVRRRRYAAKARYPLALSRLRPAARSWGAFDDRHQPIPGLWGEILGCIVYPAIFLAFLLGPHHASCFSRSPDERPVRSFRALRPMTGSAGTAPSPPLSERTRPWRCFQRTVGSGSGFLPVTKAYVSHDFEDLSQTFRGWTRRLASGGSVLRLPRLSYPVQAGVIFSVGLLPFLTVGASYRRSGGGAPVLGASPEHGPWHRPSLSSSSRPRSGSR